MIYQHNIKQSADKKCVKMTRSYKSRFIISISLGTYFCILRRIFVALLKIIYWVVNLNIYWLDDIVLNEIFKA